MMATTIITRDEWLAALGEMAVNDPLAATIAELQAMVPTINRVTLYRRLLTLIEAGHVTRTWKTVPTVSGAKRTPAYRLAGKGSIGSLVAGKADPSKSGRKKSNKRTSR